MLCYGVVSNGDRYWGEGKREKGKRVGGFGLDLPKIWKGLLGAHIML
jgi:hypothetical protein